MNEVIAILSWINDVIFVSLVNTSLQIALLIPLVALSIWMFRVKSAATRHSLWLFVLAAIILLPLLTPFIPQMDFSRLRHQGTMGYRPDDAMELAVGGEGTDQLPEASGYVSSADMTRASTKEANVSLINPVSVAYFIWCAGMLFSSWVIISIYGRLRRLRICSSQMMSQTALKMLSQLKDRLGIKRSVALKASSEIYSPVSMGIFHPAIIVPHDVIHDGSGHQLEMILIHELAHIKRNDYLISLLQNIARAVFFFHPLFYLLNRSLAKEREHVCDDWVIDTTGHRNGYAECILSLLERAVYKPANIPAIMAMAERKRDIPGRIDMIVDKNRKIATKTSRKALAAMLIIGCLSLPFIGGVELIRVAIARPASNEGWIVFARDNNIWIMNADGKNERQLTNEALDCTPAWSPDGKQIAFSRSTGDFNDIYIMNADGSGLRQLTAGPEHDVYPCWSPDLRQIAFERAFVEIKDGEWNVLSMGIYVIDLDGANLRKLTGNLPFPEEPDWSKDGSKIVFDLWNEGDVTKPHEIWVMDADGRNQKKIISGGRDPAWSPDGKSIVFAGQRERGAGSLSDIYIMDQSGENIRPVNNPPWPWWEDCPKWSPDGTKIVFFSNREGNCDIYTINSDGQNFQQLTNTPEQDYEPDWTAFSYVVEPAGKLRSTWGKIKRGLP